jgi:SpoVK/Ycf46/Vps4 family AAA+-type ATPase
MVGINSYLEIQDLIRARYVLIYVVSPEEGRVENVLIDMAAKKLAVREPGADGKEVTKPRKVVAWSCSRGFEQLNGHWTNSEIEAPEKALDYIATEQDHCIFVLRDFHPYLKNPKVTRKLRDLAHEFSKGSGKRRTIVLLSSTLNVPLEIDKEVAVIDFDLPTREEIDGIVRALGNQQQSRIKTDVLVNDTVRDRVVDAALGLTHDEIIKVFSKALIRKNDFDLDTILGEKKHIIRKSGILEFYEAQEEMGDVGGLEVLKDWLRKRSKAFSTEAREFGLSMPKGILLLGLPGCGKSLTAKAIGSQWKMPLLRLDLGKVMGSLVGQSEENMRKAIKTAEAVAPCIMWIDELEKGLAGSMSSGQTDGGTSARVFGSFISWMQEKTSPVFVIATANNVKQLPPELLRKGRFDEIFFVDLPSPDERKTIAAIHVRKKARDPEEFDLDKIVAATQGFSGSELEQAIASALYDVYEDGVKLSTDAIVKSCEEIIPLSYTMKETIDGMRNWSKHRARSASVEGAREAVEEDVRDLEF